MNQQQQNDLVSLNQKKAILRDRVRQVAKRQSTGVYIYGRPGTAKTYTVVKTLEGMGVPYERNAGHLTPIGLFKLLEENQDRVVVLDDVSAIFNAPISLQILLAATGQTPSGKRVVSHKTAAGNNQFIFSGGIVAISNLKLNGHKSEVLSALKDRIFAVEYEPTDDEICAEIFRLAAEDTPLKGLVPKEKKEVAHFFIEQSLKREIRPSIRLYVDKALPDYRSSKEKTVETNWKDLVVSNLEQMCVELTKPLTDLTSKEKKELNIRIAGEIYEGIDSAERLAVWKERTGLNKNRYYDCLKEWKKTQS